MQIKSPEQLKEAIELAKNGDEEILFDIGKYITYNFYMNNHIKTGSPEDKENEKIYENFKLEHPTLFKKVEDWVDYNFKKFEDPNG